MINGPAPIAATPAPTAEGAAPPGFADLVAALILGAQPTPPEGQPSSTVSQIIGDEGEHTFDEMDGAEGSSPETTPEPVPEASSPRAEPAPVARLIPTANPLPTVPADPLSQEGPAKVAGTPTILPYLRAPGPHPVDPPPDNPPPDIVPGPTSADPQPVLGGGPDIPPGVEPAPVREHGTPSVNPDPGAEAADTPNTPSVGGPPVAHHLPETGDRPTSYSRQIRAPSFPPPTSPVLRPETAPAPDLPTPDAGAPGLPSSSGQLEPSPEGTSPDQRPVAAADVAGERAEPVSPTGPRPLGALPDRVEAAIRALEQAPPPRSVTLRLEEMDGIRLTIALRSDGVHLTSSEGPTGLIPDLERALAARGFDLAGSPGDRRHSQGREERPDPGWRPSTARAARPATREGIQL